LRHETIRKPSLSEFPVAPNLRDWAAERKAFSWDVIAKECRGLPGGGLNKGFECIDRHVLEGRGGKTALRWESKEGKIETFTFAQAKEATDRIGNLLRGLGVARGDRVFVFLERVPELYWTVFGTLKAGGVAGPLFSAFGPEAIRDRVADSEAKVLVTSTTLIDRVREIRNELPALRHVLVTNRARVPFYPQAGESSFEEAYGKASATFEIEPTRPEDFSIMHYTSGTTGKPKGAVHWHRAILGQRHTARICLDLHPDDIYWCTADPGWVTGTSYGMFGPWSLGVTQVVYEGPFDAEKWYAVLERHGVTVWYSAPTAIRMLMKAGKEAASKSDLSRVRFCASVGEPLNPEAIVWARDALGKTFHDNWWQTETGCIQISNYAAMDVRPGSMGRPIPGTEAAVIDASGKEVPAGQEGDLALKPGWPSMFRTYWKKKELYDSRFKNGWYITGDRAWKDEDGYFWFVGRADDVIKTAGHLVGPFEVESALVEHPAVAEAAVIGKPDPERYEIIKAFVSLRAGCVASDALKAEIANFVRNRLAAHAYPREIEFLPGLPKTRSGKIMRRLLKARELGLPEGDTSTLEE
jgi:acetyl-CoA synthetase